MADRVGAGSHEVRFYHESCGTLSVYTGLDQIQWGYNLNTQTFPTYAGEVVQILSVYIDNMSLTGTLRTYNETEILYGYFLKFFHVATQGAKKNPTVGKTSYNQTPMTMTYPHRGWSFDIIPLSLPGWRRGREVVAPTWQLEAHVVDHAGDVSSIKEMVITEAQMQLATHSKETFDLQGKIGFTDENPFSDPFTKHGSSFEKDKTHEAFGKLADWYNKIIPSYMNGDFDSLTGGFGSKPAFGVNKKSLDKDAKTGRAIDKTIRGK